MKLIGSIGNILVKNEIIKFREVLSLAFTHHNFWKYSPDGLSFSDSVILSNILPTYMADVINSIPNPTHFNSNPDLWPLSKEISNLLKNSKKISALRNHDADPSGKSRVKDVVFKHKSGSILLECFDWSKEITEQKNWVDNFGVSLYSTQFYTWLNTKAY